MYNTYAYIQYYEVAGKKRHMASSCGSVSTDLKTTCIVLENCRGQQTSWREAGISGLSLFVKLASQMTESGHVCAWTEMTYGGIIVCKREKRRVEPVVDKTIYADSQHMSTVDDNRRARVMLNI